NRCSRCRRARGSVDPRRPRRGHGPRRRSSRRRAGRTRGEWARALHDRGAPWQPNYSRPAGEEEPTSTHSRVRFGAEGEADARRAAGAGRNVVTEKRGRGSLLVSPTLVVGAVVLKVVHGRKFHDIIPRELPGLLDGPGVRAFLR